MNDSRAVRWQTVLVFSAVFAAVAVLTFADLVHGSARTLDVNADSSIYSGRWIAHSGIPHHDPITLLGHGRRWIDTSWLGQLAVYGLWTAGGFALLAGVAATLGVLLVLGITGLVLRRTHSVLLAISGGLIALAGLDRWLGPQTAVMGLLVGLPSLIVLTRSAVADRIERRTWLVLPLIVLWCNLDPSALIGLIAVLVTMAVIALRAASREDLRTMGLAGLFGVSAFAATLVSPYGYHVLPQLIQTAGVGNLRSLVPGRSGADIASGRDAVWWACVSLIGAFGLVALVRQTRLSALRRPPLGPVVVVLIAVACLAAGSLRRDMQPWSILVMVCMAAATTQPLNPMTRLRGPSVAAVLVAALIWMVRRSWFQLPGWGWIIVWTVVGLVALLWSVRASAISDDHAARRSARTWRAREPLRLVTMIVTLGLTMVLLVRSVDFVHDVHASEPGVDRALIQQLTHNHHAGQSVLASIATTSSLLVHDSTFSGHVLIDSRVEVFRPTELLSALSVLASGSPSGAAADATLIVIPQTNSGALLTLAQTGDWQVHPAGKWIVLTRLHH